MLYFLASVLVIALIRVMRQNRGKIPSPATCWSALVAVFAFCTCLELQQHRDFMSAKDHGFAAKSVAEPISGRRL